MPYLSGFGGIYGEKERVRKSRRRLILVGVCEDKEVCLLTYTISRTALAKQALIPRMADYIERSATRGFQDVELKIETRKYNSTDELVKALSVQKAFERATVQKKGSETVYMLESVTPSEGRSVEVNAEKSLIDPNSERIDWTWDYSIVAYKDGSCRFVVLIH